MEFIKWEELTSFLEEACTWYEKTAPTVSQYVDELYVRLNETQAVDLREITFIQRLKECNQWLHPNYAANQLYHLMVNLGMDTTGHIGF